jgi:hypothetical protein
MSEPEQRHNACIEPILISCLVRVGIIDCHAGAPNGRERYVRLSSPTEAGNGGGDGRLLTYTPRLMYGKATLNFEVRPPEEMQTTLTALFVYRLTYFSEI